MSFFVFFRHISWASIAVQRCQKHPGFIAAMKTLTKEVENLVSTESCYDLCNFTLAMFIDSLILPCNIQGQNLVKKYFEY